MQTRQRYSNWIGRHDMLRHDIRDSKISQQTNGRISRLVLLTNSSEATLDYWIHSMACMPMFSRFILAFSLYCRCSFSTACNIHWESRVDIIRSAKEGLVAKHVFWYQWFFLLFSKWGMRVSWRYVDVIMMMSCSSFLLWQKESSIEIDDKEASKKMTMIFDETI